MEQSIPLTHLPDNTLYGEGDVFVLFGELFGRGYATGLIDSAKAAGMTIVGITVGRREDDGTLRALTDEELAGVNWFIEGIDATIPK